MGRALVPANISIACCVLALGSLATPSVARSQGVFGQDPVVFVESGFDPFLYRSVEHEARSLQVLPDGLIYHPYLAGPKESRIALQFSSENDEVFGYCSD